MCEMNTEMTIPSSRSLIFEVKSTGSELAFIRVLRLGLGNARAVSAFVTEYSYSMQIW